MVINPLLVKELALKKLQLGKQEGLRSIRAKAEEKIRAVKSAGVAKTKKISSLTTQDKSFKNQGFRMGLSLKISLILGLLLIAVFASLTIYISKSSYDKSSSDRIEYDKANNTLQASRISSMVAVVDQANNQAAVEIDKILQKSDNDKSIDDLVEIQTAILESSPFFLSGTIALEANAFDGKDEENAGKPYRDSDGRVIIYGYRDAEGKIKREMLDKSAYEGNGEDALWYTRVRDRNTGNLTDPYEFDGRMMISVSRPLTNKGVFAGVISTDIDFESVRTMLSSVSTAEYSYNLSDIEGNLLIIGNEGMADAGSSAKERGNIVDITSSATYMIKMAKDDATASATVAEGEAGDDGSASIDVVNTITGEREMLTSVPVKFSGYPTRWILFSSVDYDYFIKDSKTMVTNTAFISVIALLVLMAVVVLVIKFGISNLIQRVDRALGNISNYDLSDRAEAKEFEAAMKRNDEIGNISRSLSSMTKNLRGTITAISQSFHALTGTVGEMKDTASSSAFAATEINKAVEGIAQGASSQAADTQRAGMSVEEIKDILDANAMILNQLIKATKNIELLKEEGSRELADLAGLFNESSKGSRDVDAAIRETSDSVIQIEKASEMIESIARQTNLLALNAAIEAARAGQAGRGFAVVAAEIRRLAEQSAEFTKEISRVISSLKENSGNSVQIMNRINSIMDQQNTSLVNTQSKFENISLAVDETKQIADSLDQSSSEIKEKNSNLVEVIQNLAAIAEENAAIAEEASATSSDQLQAAQKVSQAGEELAKIAELLKTEVDKFKLQDQATEPVFKAKEVKLVSVWTD